MVVVVWGAMHIHFRVKPNYSVEVVLLGLLQKRYGFINTLYNPGGWGSGVSGFYNIQMIEIS